MSRPNTGQNRPWIEGEDRSMAWFECWGRSYFALLPSGDYAFLIENTAAPGSWIILSIQELLTKDFSGPDEAMAWVECRKTIV